MQEAHQAKLAALLTDVVDVPAHLLDLAAKEWVRSNRFLPSAAELIQLAQVHVPAAAPAIAPGETLADTYNARLVRDHPNRSRGIGWVDTPSGPELRWRA